MPRTAEYWIKKLGLQPHPEGGFYKRVYTSETVLKKESLPGSFHGDRPACTHIYYLLKENDFSAFHRIQSDELWHFYDGNELVVYEIEKDGLLTEHILSSGSDEKGNLFCVIKAGNWFAARLKSKSGYALVGCTVSPGFDFAEFELADKEKLSGMYPQHARLINALTR